MSRLFGELSGRRSGEKQPSEGEKSVASPVPPQPPEPPRPAPEAQQASRSPMEVALRHEVERLRQEIERQKALGLDRDQILQEREGKVRAQLDELESARQRVGVLEARQRQFAEKIRIGDQELGDARKDAKDSKEALEYERHLRAADAGRLTDLAAEVGSEQARRAVLEKVKGELAARLAELQRDGEARTLSLQTELKNARDRVATLESRQGQSAEKLRSMEPTLQAAQTEAQRSLAALAAREASLKQVESRCQALSARLAEAQRAEAAAQEAAKATADRAARDQAQQRAELEKRLAESVQQGESRVASLEGELSSARQRTATLEDRQRQITAKVGVTDKELAAARTAAEQVSETLEHEKRLHEATSARLADAEAVIKEDAAARKLQEQKERELTASRVDLERRLSSLTEAKDNQAKAQESELRAARDRVALLEDRQRQFAAKIQTLEPELAASRAEVQKVREALAREQKDRSAGAERFAALKKQLDEQTVVCLGMQKAGGEAAKRRSELEKELESVRLAHAGAVESARTETERLRKELAERGAVLERQAAAAAAERDRLAHEKEESARAAARQVEEHVLRASELAEHARVLEGELKAVRERAAMLDDRQRQFAAKIQSVEPELAVSKAEAQKARAALDQEKEAHGATRQSLADTAARLSDAEQGSEKRGVALRDADIRATAMKAELAQARQALEQSEAAALAALDRSEHETAGRCAELERACKAIQQERDRAAKDAGERIAALEGELASASQAARSGTQALETELAALRGGKESLEAELSKERRLRAEQAERFAAQERELRAALELRQDREAALKIELAQAREQAAADAHAAANRTGDELRVRCADLERKCEAAKRERDELAKERDGQARSAEEQIAAARERIGELENRQGQFAEKIQAGEASLRAAEAQAQAYRESLEREQHMHVATTGRMNDLEVQVRKHEEAVVAERAEERNRAAARLAGIESRLAEEVQLHVAEGLSAKEHVEKANRMVAEAEERCRELGRRISQVESDKRDLQKQLREMEAVAGVGPAGWRRRLCGAPVSVLAIGLVCVCTVAFVAGVLRRSPGAGTEKQVTGADKTTVAQAVPSKPLPLEWPVLQDTGVQVTISENERTMVFEKGVFVRYAEIGLPAQESLRALASQMKPFLGRLLLEIEGHTDSDPLVGHPVYHDNKELGQARADAVYAFLRGECGVSAANMAATSAGSERPPFSNETLDGKRKNRTVVLRLRSTEVK